MIFHQINISLGQRQTPSTPPPSSSPPPAQPTTFPATCFSPGSVSPASQKSPRSPSNRTGTHEQQRKVFLQHLTRWSHDHDSSPYFHGKISIAPRAAPGGEILELGKSVSCILSHSAFTDSRRAVVIRLFPPHDHKMSKEQGSKVQKRKKSMDMFGSRVISDENHEEDTGTSDCLPNPQPPPGKYSSIPDGYYKLVVRCGSGWMSAREYFNKLHFSSLLVQKTLSPSTPNNGSLDKILANRSKTLGTPPRLKDTVPIQPLFHPFTRLPPELQELILFTATSLFGTYNMCNDTRLFPQPDSNNAQLSTSNLQSSQSCISLSTLLLISPHLNRALIPYIFAATTFHFGLTGFTNFLWQAGPQNRPRIRRLAFHFGKSALLHCVRWLAPDHVFELFEPPVVTTPQSLQYFWRCQIQDLANEVHLLSLTVDVRNMPVQDLGMVVKILKVVFGTVERVRFVETERNGRVKVLDEEDERVKMAMEGGTWREMCRGYFQRYSRHQYLMRFELVGVDGAVLEERMEERAAEFNV
ncbi:hypothetical protein IAQ61_009562 [Plenodomus lingam]|uniref:F-box domain-containing protein n=1 Tax=Leptosphaeria maculans (strain JN3 / isolate v23.1.3 / race Av1-4-5-6-7-8) TaxID=985895 RepID=E4ZT13_LEPMJ|nr:hypothetical protein LEMA_P120920.1 [Plenodomus lingam JN3]KAH9863285.1 hypothetical protein IAQ61_009562 [Plenodomus lingam]CBX94601.1 hypothetical protein LEMA_P120920.1 [Plenodomus lingam JN3]